MPRIKVIVPIPMDESGVAHRRAQLPAERIAPGYTVDFEAVRFGAALGDSYYDSLLMDYSVFEAGLDAQDQGYDAVLIDTVSDSGLYALRSRLDIPVVAPGQAALHTALMLGHTVSIVTMWPQWFHFYRKILKEYGLEARCASLRSIDTRPDLQDLLDGKEEVVFEKLERESLAAIKEDGADVILLGSTTMHQSHGYLAERLPAPVINPGVVAYKICELLLDCGLSHSKKAFPPPEMPNDAAILSGRAYHES